MNTPLSFDEWMKIGVTQGYAGAPICSTHDGIPMTPEEEQEFDDGNDPCVHVVRLYETLDIKTAVEENHAPSIWRNHYGTE